jgi:hypothetical protein
MATEAQPSAAVDAFFTDTFDLGASLPEIYRDEMYIVQCESGEEPVVPFPLYAAHHKLYVPEQAIYIKPEAFHHAYDMSGGTPTVITDAVIETATAHYEQLRGFGMKVVGHLFEPVPESFEGLQTNSRYPTTMVATKFQVRERSAGVTAQMDDPMSRVIYQEVADRTFGRTLSEEAIKDLGLTSEDLEEAIIAPVREYYAWCKAEGEEYVLTSLELSQIHNYAYHPVGHIGLTEVTSSLGSVELGNLSSSEQRFQHFADTLQAAA